MKLRSREQFCLRTPCDPQTVLETLRTHTVDSVWSRSGDTDVCFFGKIPSVGRTFTLRPVWLGRGSFVPELCCTLEPEGSGALLYVTARCSRLARTFIAVWYGLLALYALFAAAALLKGACSWGILALPVGWAWGAVLFRFGFRRPLDRARRNLCHLLRGTIIPEPPK